MRIIIGADHRGYRLKEHLKRFLTTQGIAFDDCGNDRYEYRDDFTVFAERVGRRVAKRRGNRGLLICGNGIGVCIAANKIRGIRAATVHTVRLAKSSRRHDDANVLCLGASYVTRHDAERIVLAWLQAPFEHAERRVRRLRTIAALERRR